MTNKKTKQPARRVRPDTSKASVRQAIAAEQAKTRTPRGMTAPWGNSSFSLAQHGGTKPTGCMTHEQRAAYSRGDIGQLPDGCFYGHPMATGKSTSTPANVPLK